MKNTTNVFLKGMTSDMHPLTTSQQEYTDALNATLITFNGNEQMMQNDMGNTKIQDTKTGNIMGLREGFIPVGLKEHGGIMYIASVNKDGVGEIGTIPSPVIRYNKKDEFDIDQLLLTMDSDKGYGDLVKLTNYPLKAGDKFVVFLPLDNTSSGDASFDCIDSDNNQITITTPIIENNTNQGIYRIGLYSQADGQVYDLNDLVDGQSFSFLLRDASDNSITLNNRWFVDQSDLTLDVDAAFVNENSETRENSSFIMYPRISSGYPSVRLEINRLDSFSLLPNHTSTLTTDDNRRYPFTIFDNSDPDNQKYITFIRGFEYTTSSGIHPTKLKISLINDTTGEFVKIFNIENENSDSDDSQLDEQIEYLNNKEYTLDTDAYRYCISSNSELRKFNISFIESEDYNNLENSYYDNSDNWANGIALDIGPDSNIWFTLTVDYYYTDNGTDIKLGTYTCRYNPYVYDTLKNFRQVKYVVNENYNGEGNTWFQQYYDVKQRYATNIERTFSKQFVSEGNPNNYPYPSGCGVNQKTTTLSRVSGVETIDPSITAAFVQYGYNGNYEDPKGTDWEFTFSGGGGSQDDMRGMSFYRSGVRMQDLINSAGNPSDYTTIVNIMNWPDNNSRNAEYLYKNNITRDTSNSIISINYQLNNLGFRIVGDDFSGPTAPADWEDFVNIVLYFHPDNRGINVERKNHYRGTDPNQSESDNDSICVFAPSTPYLSGQKDMTLSQFETYCTSNAPIFSLIGSLWEKGIAYDSEIYWLSGDPSQTNDGYSNNSILTLDVNLSAKLNITGISDYQVIPQINVVYEEDGQIYPGYLNGGIVEEIDADITNNYFLKNGISEGNYIFNTTYHSFEDTSIYGSGFGYHTLSGELSNPISLETTGEIDGDKFILNLNTVISTGEYIRIYFDNINNILAGWGCDKYYDGTNYYLKLAEGNTLISFKLTGNCKILKIDACGSGGGYLITPKYTSLGLYKARSEYNINNKPKLQTVYTYSEEKWGEDENHDAILIPNKCLDKDYGYKGGSAFCGYQKSEAIYIIDDLHDNKITYNDTEIEVRRCLAPQ